MYLPGACQAVCISLGSVSCVLFFILIGFVTYQIWKCRKVDEQKQDQTGTVVPLLPQTCDIFVVIPVRSLFFLHTII